MVDGINGAGNASQISGATLGPSSSLQLIFAKLQLELAESAKTQAMDRMEAIKNTQEEQKVVAALLNEARQAKADAKDKDGLKKDVTITYYNYDADGKRGSVKDTCTYSKGDTCRPMSDEMLHYMDSHDLAYDKTGNDYKHNADEWDVAIKSLEGRLEQLGTDTQQQMVYVQDYMGQYNSYLQGANTQISESNRTLGALAKGQ